MLFWDLYEIESNGSRMHGIMLRGRIRKFAVENNITCLVENAEDKENVVRFGVITGTDISEISKFVRDIIGDPVITKCIENTPNPVLSKLKVNDLSRY